MYTVMAVKIDSTRDEDLWWHSVRIMNDQRDFARQVASVWNVRRNLPEVAKLLEASRMRGARGEVGS